MEIVNKYFIFLTLFLVFVIMNCNKKNDGIINPDISKNINTDLNYPAKILPLPSDKLIQLQAEFDSLNENKLSSKLNKYGFVGNDIDYRS